MFTLVTMKIESKKTIEANEKYSSTWKSCIVLSTCFWPRKPTSALFPYFSRNVIITAKQPEWILGKTQIPNIWLYSAGEIPSGRVQPVSWIFNPLEPKTYEVNIPVHLSNGETELIQICGRGFLPSTVCIQIWKRTRQTVAILSLHLCVSYMSLHAAGVVNCCI